MIIGLVTLFRLSSNPKKKLLQFFVVSVFSLTLIVCFPLKARSLESDQYVWKKHGPTLLKLPASYKPKKAQLAVFHNEHFSLRLSAESFSQGDIVYVELLPVKNRIFRAKIIFHQKKVSLNYLDNQAFGYFAIPPNLKPGRHNIHIRYSSGNIKKFVYRVNIKKTKFGRTAFKIRLKGKKKTPKRLLRKIARERRLKARIFARNSRKIYLANRFALPRDHFHITSDFWEKREVHYYRIHKKKRVNLRKRNKIHKGVDLRGLNGSPIFAMAPGRVILAKKLHYEGNFIVIDHGQNIFSGYMHLNKINTSVGARVKAGQKIGESGSTGVVTGPHLHLLVRINGIYANPLSIYSLPVSIYHKKNQYRSQARLQTK